MLWWLARLDSGVYPGADKGKIGDGGVASCARATPSMVPSANKSPTNARGRRYIGTSSFKRAFVMIDEPPLFQRIDGFARYYIPAL